VSVPLSGKAAMLTRRRGSGGTRLTRKKVD
jgi:hypothetical protein